MNINMQRDFQICISVPLSMKSLVLKSFVKSYRNFVILKRVMDVGNFFPLTPAKIEFRQNLALERKFMVIIIIMLTYVLAS